MKYTKPEVSVLGEAAVVIEQIGPTSKPDFSLDGSDSRPVNPAYDLDE